MENSNDTAQKKLSLLLSKVQKETVREEFIYGLTDRSGRSFFQRIKDFLIDKSSISTKEKAYFFELLATLVHAGIPLNKSLKILVSKTENARMRRIIATLSYEIEHGKPFSQALERFSDIFPETQRAVIRSSEAVGNLEQMLSKIAGSLERQNEVAMRLKSALIYPITVVAALFIASAVMMVYVVPRIQEIFSESGISLPITTKILLSSSVFFEKAWWLLLIFIVFGIALFHLYTGSEEGRFYWDFRKLRIPIAGVLLRKICVLRFVDTLGVLVESGLPINKALEFTANAIGNEVYRVKTYEALGKVQEGEKLSASLGEAPFLFPESVTNMIAVGEHAASIGSISQKIGSHFEREIDHTLKNMTTVLGPLLILLVGAAVAFFALSVLSPIFSLTQSI